MKKIVSIFFVIIFLFVIYLSVTLSKHNYHLEYTLNGFKVKEEYLKKGEYYKFTISDKNDTYKLVLFDSYSNKRKLLREIKKEKECIYPKSDYVKTYGICKNNNELVASGFNNIKNTKTDFKKYKNNLVYDLNGKRILIWNYTGIDVLETEFKTIKLLNKDIYDIDLANIYNDYFMIPNYDQDFTFNEIYLYNIKKGTLTTWKLNNDISFDSYILGSNNKSVFMYDTKHQTEYEMVYHKKKIRQVKPKLWQNEKWVNTSHLKLTQNKQSFVENEPIKYVVDNNKLYKVIDDYKELITNNKVKTIVYKEMNDIYYISDDKLYVYSPFDGDKLLVENFEWNFNYKNIVFIS